MKTTAEGKDEGEGKNHGGDKDTDGWTTSTDRQEKARLDAPWENGTQHIQDLFPWRRSHMKTLS